MDAPRLDPEAGPAASPAAAGPRPAHRFRLGPLDLRVFDAGTFPLSAGFIAINAPPQALAAARTKAGLPEGDFPFPLRGDEFMRAFITSWTSARQYLNIMALMDVYYHLDEADHMVRMLLPERRFT